MFISVDQLKPHILFIGTYNTKVTIELKTDRTEVGSGWAGSAYFDSCRPLSHILHVTNVPETSYSTFSIMYALLLLFQQCMRARCVTVNWQLSDYIYNIVESILICRS